MGNYAAIKSKAAKAGKARMKCYANGGGVGTAQRPVKGTTVNIMVPPSSGAPIASGAAPAGPPPSSPSGGPPVPPAAAKAALGAMQGTPMLANGGRVKVVKKAGAASGKGRLQHAAAQKRA